ncbi:HEAT repeat domain-containing protein [Gimesia chilikensis]|uniref:HEAT repeat domain-containing protein n=1 Tax=Gimesia chilikensis TaxID=2605989 RepID=UPI0011A357B7|nr:HEAT repeat domain-containing protein [Gimesia chilikensis]
MRQSRCSYEAFSVTEVPAARITGFFLLVAGLFFADSSLLFGQNEAPANPPEAKQQNDKALSEYKPLMKPEEAVNFRKTKLRDFDELLRGGKISSSADKKLIADGARYQLYLMTFKNDPNKPENATDLKKLRANILRDIQFSGRVSGNYQARELYLEELTKQAPDLFDNHRLVRFSAVVLLSELDLRDEDRRKKTKRTAYTLAYAPLLKVIESKTQPIEVKIVAANGLGRIGEMGDPSNALRVKIAEALIPQLKNSIQDHSWYQRSLVDALGSLGITDNLARQPVVVDALLDAMKNPKRTWGVRSAAAYNIGKLPLNARSDIKLITYSIVDLTRKMVAEYNKNNNARFWKRCFWNVYLAFKPANQGSDEGLTQKKVNQTVVNDAYKQIIKPVATIVQPGNPPKIAADVTKSMDDWLKKNLPKNFRVAPVQVKPNNQQVAEGN